MKEENQIRILEKDYHKLVEENERLKKDSQLAWKSRFLQLYEEYCALDTKMCERKKVFNNLLNEVIKPNFAISNKDLFIASWNEEYAGEFDFWCLEETQGMERCKIQCPFCAKI